MNTLQAAFLAGANVCWQSAGWLEGGLVTSLEKFAADLELLDLYEPPPLDESVEEELVEYVERRAAELGDEISVR